MIILILFVFLSDLLRITLKSNCIQNSTLMIMYLPGADMI